MAAPDELLERELSWTEPWRDVRFVKTRPAGVNAMNAIAAVVALVCLGLSLQLVGNVSAERTPGRLVLFTFFCVASGVFGVWASRRIWRVIGRVGRAIARPFGLLGPMPLVVMSIIGGAVLLRLPGVAADRKAAEAGDVYLGVEFAPVTEASGALRKLTRAEALEACTAMGARWRLPASGDEAFLRERLLRSTLRRAPIHAEGTDPGGLSTFVYDTRKKQFTRTLLQGEARAAVVCIQPPG